MTLVIIYDWLALTVSSPKFLFSRCVFSSARWKQRLLSLCHEPLWAEPLSDLLTLLKLWDGFFFFLQLTDSGFVTSQSAFINLQVCAISQSIWNVMWQTCEGAEVTDRMTFAANHILQYMLSKTIFHLVMVKVFDLNGNCGKGLCLGLRANIVSYT